MVVVERLAQVSQDMRAVVVVGQPMVRPRLLAVLAATQYMVVQVVERAGA